VVSSVSGFLLDTNVISELMKPRPNEHVVQWVEATSESLLYLSVISIGEIRTGIDLLDEHEPRRAALQSWLDHDVRVRFGERLIPFDAGVVERWGQLEALARKRKLMLPTIDAELAATALQHGLTLVTRNTRHIAPTGVPSFNPWTRR
jgi:predicted nucleic acid-binding protein